jgi:hypothetical protein
MKNTSIYDLTHAVHIAFEAEYESHRWKVKPPKKRLIRKNLPERAVQGMDWIALEDFAAYDKSKRNVYKVVGKKIMVRSTVTVYFSNKHSFETKFDTEKEAVEFLLKHGKTMGLPFVYVKGQKIPLTGFEWGEIEKLINTK